jgi:hypothetical protein
VVGAHQLLGDGDPLATRKLDGVQDLLNLADLGLPAVAAVLAAVLDAILLAKAAPLVGIGVGFQKWSWLNS